MAARLAGLLVSGAKFWNLEPPSAANFFSAANYSAQPWTQLNLDPTWTQPNRPGLNFRSKLSSSPRPGVVLIRMRLNSSHRLDLSFAGPDPGRH